MKRPDNLPPANLRLADHLTMLARSNAELEQANAKLKAANDRLARFLGWDVPTAPKPVTWGAR
jgi:hypothetical protein